MADLVERLNSALGRRYQVQAKLGEGGMGFVFLAHDLKHDRKVALKVLRPELTESIGAERFLREIRISAQLTHPNILTLIDSGSADGFMYYVLPYVDGESLRDRLSREGQLPIEDALRITREIADALAYAHVHGIVHRDVKPENILLDSGHAVVTDFGIAHALSEAGGEKLTASGLAVGTPLYMSPEQATATERVDARSDVYSLACVLYEMLAGAPPFAGPTPLAILARKAVESAPGLRVVRETVPPAVEAAVLRALSRVPADRYATAEAFVDALEGRSGSTPAATHRVGFPGGRWAGAAAAMVAVAVGAYMVVTIAPRRGDSRSDLAGATFTQVTTESGVEWFPSFSPDGQWIVYSGDVNGNRDIYLQSVAGHNAIDLTRDSPDDDDQPAFSPDGEHIAFRSEREGGGIFVMGRTGEAPHRVTHDGFRPSWSPDGTRVAFSTGNVDGSPENGPGGKLWVADVATGETRRVSDVDATMPSWSPHGTRIAFAHSHGQIAHAHVWTIPADGGEAIPATEGSAPDWSPAWSADGRYLYFVSDRGGSMNLWRERIDEKSGRALGDPEAVTAGGSTSLVHVALAADGRHIAYSSLSTDNNVQRSAFDPGSALMVGDPEWITRGSREWADPEPSPDGRNVAFTSYSEPVGDIYVMPTDGSTGPRQLTEGAKYHVPRWSPDGKWITAWSKQSGSVQMWKVHPDGSGLSQVTEAASFAAYGVWSPDATRMVVGTQGPAGYVMVRFDPSRPWRQQQVATLATAPDSLAPFSPHSWSPDGARLAGMVGESDHGIVTYTFATGRYTRLTDFGQWPIWLPDSRRILFVTGRNALYVVDRVTGDVRSVFSVRRGDVIGPPGLTPDGNVVYYARRHTEGDIWVMTLR